jgi:hypothetical protein
MTKDSGVNPVYPHVATEENTGASVPLRGVANPGSPTARLETTDTGRAKWAYDLPFIPLNIPQFSDFGRILSLFELIKKHHIDTFDSDTTYDSGGFTVEDFDASDIVSKRGFMLKAGMSNAGEVYVSNVPKPYVVGSSTVYQTNSLVGTTQGSRILKDVTTPTSTSSYLQTGSNAYVGMPLLPGESIFFEITRASQIYLIPTVAGQVIHWMPI